MTCSKCKTVLAPADLEVATPVACNACMEEAYESGYSDGEEDGYKRGLREGESRAAHALDQEAS